MVQPSRVSEDYANKVPEVTLGFWIIKILATTLGETLGDSVTMTWLKADVMVNSGYLVGSAIFLSALIVLVAVQISAKRFHPFLYWSVIVASTTAGTAVADFATRSLGIGYTGGSLILFACLMTVLASWYRSEGSISVDTVSKTEGRSLLLGGDYIFPDVGNRHWRLDRRFRSWIRRRGAGLWRRTGGHCRSLLLDECVAGLAVLGRLHSNATTRCDVG